MSLLLSLRQKNKMHLYFVLVVCCWPTAASHSTQWQLAQKGEIPYRHCDVFTWENVCKFQTGSTGGDLTWWPQGLNFQSCVQPKSFLVEQKPPSETLSNSPQRVWQLVQSTDKSYTAATRVGLIPWASWKYQRTAGLASPTWLTSLNSPSSGVHRHYEEAGL